MQRDNDTEVLRASINLEDRRFTITLDFKILWTDDEDYLSDGSVTADQIEIWEDELPRDGLTISVGNQTIHPVKVERADFR